jgi:hypothetical protein
MNTVRDVLLALLASVALVAAADAELLKLIAPDARMVAGVNVAKSKATPFGRFLVAQIKEGDKDFQDFVALTQFDPRRDVSQILIAAPGTGVEKGGVVIVSGTFNVSAISGLIQSKGGAVDTYGGAQLLVGGQSRHNANGAVAFIGTSIAVAGEVESVKAAIDRRQRASSVDRNLLGKITDLDSRYDAWAISLVPVGEMAARVPNPNVSGAMKGNALQSIQQVSGGLSFGDMVTVTAEAVTRSDKDASALADVIRFLASLLQMNRQAAQAGALAAALDNMKLEADGVVTRLTMEIPAGDLEKLIQSQRAPAHVHRTAAR